jgi:thymidylate synthase
VSPVSPRAPPRAAAAAAADAARTAWLDAAHVYLNHVDALKEQLKRKPRPFPTLTIDPKVDSVEACTFDDLTIDGYDPYPKIKMDMAV